MRFKSVILILALIFICTSVSAIAQTEIIKPKLLWSRQIQLPTEDRSPHPIAANNGSVVVNIGPYKSGLVYLDPKGNIRWKYQQQGRYFGEVEISSDVSKVLLTYTRSRPDENSEYVTDHAVMFNSQGRIIWDRNGDEIMRISPSGKYVLGCGSPIISGLKMYNSSNGKLLWSRQLPQPGYVQGVSITANENRILVNQERSVFMYSTTGNRIWAYNGWIESASTSSNGGLTAMLTGGEVTRLLILNSSGSIIKTIVLARRTGNEAPIEVWNFTAVSPDGKLIVLDGFTPGGREFRGYDSVGKLLWRYNPPKEQSDLNSGVRFVTQNSIELQGEKAFYYLNRSGKLVRIVNAPSPASWGSRYMSGNRRYLAGMNGHRVSLYSIPAFK
ncbi:MAG: PQQ-binding-like beta-propeller repeat protein [Armatimonadota bacterium]